MPNKSAITLWPIKHMGIGNFSYLTVLEISPPMVPFFKIAVKSLKLGSLWARVEALSSGQAHDEMDRQYSGECPLPESQGFENYGLGLRSMERFGESGSRASSSVVPAE